MGQVFDTIFHNGIVVTVNPDFDILPSGVVSIRGDTIEKVVARDQMDQLPAADRVIDARGGIIMPGLINAHTHLPMSLFRGLADDLPLDLWLHKHIFPAEAKFIDAEHVRLGTLLSAAELLLGGTTCCCDGYFHADEVAGAVQKTGLRALLAQGVIDFPAPGVLDPSRNVAHATDYVGRWKAAGDLVQPAIFCHSPYTCGAATLKRAKTAADAAGIPLVIHLAETKKELENSRKERGLTPTAYLDSLRILDARTLLVHAVWCTPADIEIIARRGSAVVHCPESNMKLGAGVAPLTAFRAAGVPVGLGTDGCASNNDLDLFREMDTAAKLHKAIAKDPVAADARTILTMATREGARVLGMDGFVGSLEAGKKADIIVIDTRQPHLVPLHNPISQLVYAASGADVVHVMVAGRMVVRDRRLLTIDIGKVMTQVATKARAIAGDDRGRRD
jgi:5-methylthioadenosine/S-adenosylhomocysteine deaminase